MIDLTYNVHLMCEDNVIYVPQIYRFSYPEL